MKLIFFASLEALHFPYHLLCEHGDGLNGESSAADIEHIFKTGAQQVNHKDIVEALLTKVVGRGYSRYTKGRRTRRKHQRYVAVVRYFPPPLFSVILDNYLSQP